MPVNPALSGCGRLNTVTDYYNFIAQDSLADIQPYGDESFNNLDKGFFPAVSCCFAINSPYALYFARHGAGLLIVSWEGCRLAVRNVPSHSFLEAAQSAISRYPSLQGLL